MSSRTITMTTALALLSAVGCGLTDTEMSALEEQTAVVCPKKATVPVEEAAERAALVVHARADESFFVDHCHRAFLLEVESIWLGDMPDHVLAIIPTEPFEYAERWVDLDLGESAVFLLEHDPEIPDAFRPVSDGAVIPVENDIAHVCLRGLAFGCEMGEVHLDDLRDMIEAAASDAGTVSRDGEVGSARDDDPLGEHGPDPEPEPEPEPDRDYSQDQLEAIIELAADLV